MDELTTFYNKIKKINANAEGISICEARDIVQNINEFLYTNYEGIGTTVALGDKYEYFSDFHKYWESHHEEILDAKIDDNKCALVAEALHKVYILTKGKAFAKVAKTYKESKLSDEAICRIRLLTANQDFRNSIDFTHLAKAYDADPSTFDENFIEHEPSEFLSRLHFYKLSQTDKRIRYAKTIADFVIHHAESPYKLIDSFNYDLYALRNALINCQGAGYGAKKTDMVLRDMVVLGIWKNTKGFDKINVASDVNTIKVALRTGILKTAIPLVSSFIDIFCYQYSYIDEMNAKAWRRVWELWMQKYPNDNIQSPCLIDFFVYDVVGRQFCKPNLYIYQCDKESHIFPWHSPNNHTCQICQSKGIRGVRAYSIGRVMACSNKDGYIAIRKTEFVKNLPSNAKMDVCPFTDICKEKYLMPPKSISILGRTGWTSAYSRKGDGGGGLMA